MILQSAFQNDRDKVYASQEEIKMLDERHEQGQGIEIENPEAGFFEGMGEAWKGLPSGALKSMSLLEEVAANTGLSNIDPQRIEQESGYVIEDAEKHQAMVRSRLESDAKKHREEARERFGIEPDTVGMAGQVLYGLAETLPKAIGYTVATGNPVAGAVAFGADYGGSQYLEMRDKGVDKKTAAMVGTVSGVAGGVGVLLPATFGMNRVASATIGAVANMGLTGAELGTVGWILDRQNYDALAEQYGINTASVVTSGFFGAFFGGAMWRPRGRAQAEPIQRFDDVQRKTVNQSIYEQLKAVGGKYDDDVVAHTQADLHANAIENLSRVYDVPFESVESVLPSIVRDDGALNGSAFNQIVWHGSPHKFDEFSLAHIGTGEGAQAHGWGLYFAGGREVAEGYRRSLSTEKTTYKGRPLEDLAKEYLQKFEKRRDEISNMEGVSAADKRKLVRDAQTEYANKSTVITYVNIWGSVETVRKKMQNNGIDTFNDALDWYEREIAPEVTGGGRLFKVEIPDEDVMLDEQKAFKEQPKVVQDAYVELIGKKSLKQLMSEAEQVGGERAAELARKVVEAPMLDEHVPDDVADEVIDSWAELERLIGEKLTDEVNDLKSSYSELFEVTGLVMYRNLVKKFGSPKAASLALNEEGVKGIAYDGLRDGPCAVVFDDKAVKTIEYYQERGKRGSYNPASREIKLTPNANLSTFSHEMGHWYLDTMMGLSGRGSALLDADITTLLREFGVNSVDDWNALGVEGQRKYHEQFASWLEVYLTKGEAPNPSLKDVLARVAQWIVDVYESFGGTQKAVEGRFESEFGTKLPEMSDEVKAVMDRLFSEQKANRKMAAKKPTTEQVAAGRVVLQSSAATARIQKLLKKDRNKLTAKDARDLQDALRASDIAAQQMANGQAVDVADVVGDAEIDEAMMKETRGNFAREFLMGGDDSQAVVLQNRDRDTVASVAQMNRIAAKPDYYLASISRSLQDGAPIVSFGSMPDNAHLGVGDIVVGPSGRRIPVQYAVVEADSVLTSNDYLGNANPDYGNPSVVNAVAGNGRATGIREGYNRGTAEQYKADMIADTRHGVDAEVIKAMKKPLLVRFIGKDEVTSKLIEESNKQSTLARSPVEQAVDDAKLIARNVDKYQFDEDGLPTQETVQQFVADIQDPNALGRLLTPYGTVTPEAVTRVQNAVVQAAYGDMPFTQLFAMETKPGAKRLMNALVAAAPRFVEIRNSLGNAYDFSRQLLEGFKQVRESMLAGQDSVIQSGSIFGDDSASAFIDILDRNRNSMAGVMRELDPIFEAIKASQDSAGSMFGDEVLDLPEILSRVRQAENEARLAEGKPLLMDIDAEEMRQGIKAAQEMIEAVEEMQTRALEGEQVQDTQAVDPVERSRQMLTQDADAVRVQELSEEMPEMLFDIEDENGQVVKMSIADITVLNEADLAKADTEAASMGEVFACVDLNRGIE